MSTIHKLGDLQLSILQVLWRQGEATVAEVHADLQPERGLAPTTIATMLTKMEKKGVVSHRTEGRRFVYQPEVSESEVCQTMVGTLTDQLFRGRPAALVSYLLSEHEIDPQELTRLRQLMDQLEEKEQEES